MRCFMDRDSQFCLYDFARKYVWWFVLSLPLLTVCLLQKVDLIYVNSQLVSMEFLCLRHLHRLVLKSVTYYIYIWELQLYEIIVHRRLFLLQLLRFPWLKILPLIRLSFFVCSVLCNSRILCLTEISHSYPLLLLMLSLCWFLCIISMLDLILSYSLFSFSLSPVKISRLISLAISRSRSFRCHPLLLPFYPLIILLFLPHPFRLVSKNVFYYIYTWESLSYDSTVYCRLLLFRFSRIYWLEIRLYIFLCFLGCLSLCNSWILCLFWISHRHPLLHLTFSLRWLSYITCMLVLILCSLMRRHPLLSPLYSTPRSTMRFLCNLWERACYCGGSSMLLLLLPFPFRFSLLFLYLFLLSRIPFQNTCYLCRQRYLLLPLPLPYINTLIVSWLLWKNNIPIRRWMGWDCHWAWNKHESGSILWRKGGIQSINLGRLDIYGWGKHSENVVRQDEFSEEKEFSLKKAGIGLGLGSDRKDSFIQMEGEFKVREGYREGIVRKKKKSRRRKVGSFGDRGRKKRKHIRKIDCLDIWMGNVWIRGHCIEERKGKKCSKNNGRKYSRNGYPDTKRWTKCRTKTRSKDGCKSEAEEVKGFSDRKVDRRLEQSIEEVEGVMKEKKECSGKGKEVRLKRRKKRKENKKYIRVEEYNKDWKSRHCRGSVVEGKLRKGYIRNGANGRAWHDTGRKDTCRYNRIKSSKIPYVRKKARGKREEGRRQKCKNGKNSNRMFDNRSRNEIMQRFERKGENGNRRVKRNRSSYVRRMVRVDSEKGRSQKCRTKGKEFLTENYKGVNNPRCCIRRANYEKVSEEKIVEEKHGDWNELRVAEKRLCGNCVAARSSNTVNRIPFLLNREERRKNEYVTPYIVMNRLRESRWSKEDPVRKGVKMYIWNDGDRNNINKGKEEGSEEEYCRDVGEAERRKLKGEKQERIDEACKGVTIRELIGLWSGSIIEKREDAENWGIKDSKGDKERVSKNRPQKTLSNNMGYVRGDGGDYRGWRICYILMGIGLRLGINEIKMDKQSSGKEIPVRGIRMYRRNQKEKQIKMENG